MSSSLPEAVAAAVCIKHALSSRLFRSDEVGSVEDDVERGGLGWVLYGAVFRAF